MFVLVGVSEEQETLCIPLYPFNFYFFKWQIVDGLELRHRKTYTRKIYTWITHKYNNMQIYIYKNILKQKIIIYSKIKPQYYMEYVSTQSYIDLKHLFYT